MTMIKLRTIKGEFGMNDKRISLMEKLSKKNKETWKLSKKSNKVKWGFLLSRFDQKHFNLKVSRKMKLKQIGSFIFWGQTGSVFYCKQSECSNWRNPWLFQLGQMNNSTICCIFSIDLSNHAEYSHCTIQLVRVTSNCFSWDRWTIMQPEIFWCKI